MDDRNQFTFGDFVWWTGIVEDVNDPEKLGRVKVRAFGYHNKDQNSLPTSQLPWAMVAGSAEGANTQGIGRTPHGLIKDSHVVGFFLDGKGAQLPMILFTYPGIKDGMPDVNKLARGEVVKKELDNAGDWSEKSSGAAPLYPHNKVIETTSGHIIEIDDTPGKERLHIMHKSGTFTELHTDGSMVRHVKGDDYTIVQKNQFIHVKGNVNLIVDGNVDETIKGNKTSKISGNYTVTCNSYSMTTKASWTNKVGSSGVIKCGGTLTEKASIIYLN